MPGRRNWDQAAAAIWPALVNAAAASRTLTYSDIAPLIPTNPLSVGRALGPLQTYCIEANLPPLTAGVVSKSTGLPGNGFVAWDVDDLDEGLAAVFSYPWKNMLNPFGGFSEGQTEADFATLLIEDPDTAADVYSRIKNRGVAQRIFRRALLESYRYSCCMCGNTFESNLEAAHITPWGESTKQERLDVRNGLLLCSNHHRMFDAAQITVGPDFRIEYYDPAEEDGIYSSIDQELSIKLHNTQISLPAHSNLNPCKHALAKRQAADGWN